MRRYFSSVLGYWKALGHLIGLVMTPVHMFLVYVLVFGPACLIARVTAGDLLDRKIATSPTFWKKREVHPPTLENLRHTF